MEASIALHQSSGPFCNLVDLLERPNRLHFAHALVLTCPCYAAKANVWSLKHVSTVYIAQRGTQICDLGSPKLIPILWNLVSPSWKKAARYIRTLKRRFLTNLEGRAELIYLITCTKYPGYKLS